MINEMQAILLYQLKIKGLEQKANVLNGGKGLIEPEEPEMPDKCDFTDLDWPEPSEEKPKALPQPVKKTAASSSLADMVQDENQINISDAIRDADTAISAKTTEPSPAAEEPEQPGESAPKKSIVLLERLKAYFEARGNWKVEKATQDYKFLHEKKELLAYVDGIDFMLKAIDETIKFYQENNNVQQ